METNAIAVEPLTNCEQSRIVIREAHAALSVARKDEAIKCASEISQHSIHFSWNLIADLSFLIP